MSDQNQNRNYNQNSNGDLNLNGNMAPDSVITDLFPDRTRVRYIAQKRIFCNGKIPLIAQNPIPDAVNFVSDRGNQSSATVTDDTLGRILDSVADCGFNCVIFGGSVKEMKEIAKACSERGDRDGKKRLSVILSPEWTGASIELWSDNMGAFTGEYEVDGWEIMDQPQPHNWEIPDAGFRKSFDAARALAPDKTVYYNLAASEADSWIGDTGCCMGLMAALESVADPSVWSYDLYPFSASNPAKWKSEWMNVPREDGQGAGANSPSLNNVRIEYNSFFYYLSAFARRSARTGRPFWAYCMCIAHKIGRNLLSLDLASRVIERYQPAPTAGMLRFEAFGALAFGAQGIVYWSYGAFTDSYGMTFKEAPLMNDLSRSPVWYNCQTVNREIVAFNDVFLGCRFVKAAVVGSQFPDGFTGVPDISSLSLEANDPFAQATFSPRSGASVLITHVIKDRYPWIICVNLNPFGTQSVDVHMRHTQGYLFRQFVDGGIREVIVNLWNSSKDETRTFTLAPGGILAVRVA